MCSYMPSVENVMNFRVLAVCLVGGLLAACSGAPPEGGADYEVESDGERRTSPPSGEDELQSGEVTQTDTDETDESQEADALPETGGGGEGEDPGADALIDPPPATPETKVTAKIDGVTYTVSETNLWSEVGGPGEYDIFVKLTGPGAPTGSDIHVGASRTGTGCKSGENYITYRPKGAPQYMPNSSNEPTCGLTMSELPKAVGGRFRGRFVGTLRSINTSPVTYKKITLEFDVLRTK